MGAFALWPTAESKERLRTPIILFFISFLARLAFLFQNGPLLLPDSWGRYLKIADALFNAWVGTVYDTPAYPGLMALVVMVTGSDIAIYVVQAALDSLTVCMVWSLAKRLGMNRGALMLALYFAAYPASILFACSALSETFFAFLLTSAVCLFAGSDDQRTGLRFIAIGLLLGLASLTRANGVLVLVVFAGVTFFSLSSGPKWRALGAMTCASLLLVLALGCV